jgi:hypothetical protein
VSIPIAAGEGVGRWFGSQPGAKVSMMIMRPPQHGHGRGSTGGWSSAPASDVCEEPMTKKKIDYTTMTIEQLEAAEKAAREQYESSLEIVNRVDTLPSLAEITEENVADGKLATSDIYVPAVDELHGQIIDLKQDLDTWCAIVTALFEAKFPDEVEETEETEEA